MKIMCAPNAYACQLREFPQWLLVDHGLAILACVVLATAAAWVFADAADRR